MHATGEWFNLVLGLCALGYSFMPPAGIRSYRRSVVLVMRVVGVCLIGLAIISLSLKMFTRHAG